MQIYFFLYLMPAVLAFSWVSRYNPSHQRNQSLFIWSSFGTIFTVIIGFRHVVGGDWGGYLRHFQNIQFYSISETFKRSDPGYYIINWFVSDWGYDIYQVNLVCGALFMIGLIIFAKQQPNPWLAIAVSVPYIIIVVAMGYTRQGVALGFVFSSLVALDKKHFKQFIILIAFATTFHKSAVLMIGLGVFLQGKGKSVRLLAVGFVGFGIWNAFLSNYQQGLWKNYVEAEMQSQGALIRVVMNLLPSLIFLLYRKSWKKVYTDYTFWLMIAVGSVASMFLVGLASTAVDRVALYFTPIQVVVYSRLPYLLQDTIPKQATTLMILLFYLVVLYVWLNYATHSIYWIPYNNILFEGL